MENKKTPEQWFQKLKEPYRSQAIANVVDNRPVKDLNTALEYQNIWAKTPQGFDYWNKIAVSIKAGETTYLEPETLKHEQMESGKWYLIRTKYNFLIKFDKIENLIIKQFKGYTFYFNRINHNNNICWTYEVKSIYPATKEEVLKYFPDEKWSEKIDEIIDTHVIQKLKPEPIELRPEALKAGEVYVATFRYGDHYKFIFKHRDTLKHQVNYEKMINHSLQRFENANLDKSFKFYHATPEEKKLLLGEEQTDWEAKYNELTQTCNELTQIIADLKSELAEKYNKQEPKGEKVYIHYNTKHEKWLQAESLELALQESPENKNIYEGYCIGKKKSILVSE